MTALLLTLDPALVALLLVGWGWASAYAAGLPYGGTAGVVRRRTTATLGLIAVGVLLALARVGVVALGQPGWWFVQEKVLLALPLLLAPAVASLLVSVPRLVRLRRAARVFPDVVPPSLRHEAAHPLVAWPAQATVIGAAAGLVAYPAADGSSFAVISAAGVGILACWQRLRRRHERLGGEVIFPSGRARLARSAPVVMGVAAVAVAVPLAALALAAPAPDAHADPGHTAVDPGGGPMPLHGSVPAVSIERIRGQSATATVRSFTLTARQARVRLPSGSTVDALT